MRAKWVLLSKAPPGFSSDPGSYPLVQDFENQASSPRLIPGFVLVYLYLGTPITPEREPLGSL